MTKRFNSAIFCLFNVQASSTLGISWFCFSVFWFFFVFTQSLLIMRFVTLPVRRACLFRRICYEFIRFQRCNSPNAIPHVKYWESSISFSFWSVKPYSTPLVMTSLIAFKHFYFIERWFIFGRYQIVLVRNQILYSCRADRRRKDYSSGRVPDRLVDVCCDNRTSILLHEGKGKD